MLALFNLASVYGVVRRVALSREGLQGLVEFETPEEAARAARLLAGATLRGGPMAPVQLPVARAEAAIAGAEYMQSFVGSSLQRLAPGGGAGAAHVASKHACPPTEVLHIANLPDPDGGGGGGGSTGGGGGSTGAASPSPSPGRSVEGDAGSAARVRRFQGELRGALVALLAPYGAVLAVAFPRTSCRMAYVTMDSAEHATEALMGTHNTSLGGRTIRVSFSTNKG